MSNHQTALHIKNQQQRQQPSSHYINTKDILFHDYLNLQELTDSPRDNSRWFQIEWTKRLTLQEEPRKLPPKNDAKEICEHKI